ncbi:hypothetical protein JIX56_05630 [Streptomyces sp. CA-210063]|uniref:hypothetical protein n=1 Tax=Streptomyces sp. CA-210063 TaxID=2801029 RepID=UPI00214BEB13|nr:hypothetical protein [Streptomyces sp. CA-210063]UUU36887.1 hypothetical protein JIX56_05630 [Streptomyces sp. CA-210063]
MSNRQIASAFGRSPRTVHGHVEKHPGQARLRFPRPDRVLVDGEPGTHPVGQPRRNTRAQGWGGRTNTHGFGRTPAPSLSA